MVEYTMMKQKKAQECFHRTCGCGGREAGEPEKCGVASAYLGTYYSFHRVALQRESEVMEGLVALAFICRNSKVLVVTSSCLKSIGHGKRRKCVLYRVLELGSV